MRFVANTETGVVVDTDDLVAALVQYQPDDPLAPPQLGRVNAVTVWATGRAEIDITPTEDQIR